LPPSGYERSELIGRTIDDVSFVPDRVPVLFEKFVRRGAQEGEYVLRHKTGKPVLISYIAYSFPDGCLAAVWEPVSGWRQLYSAALMELDPQKLKERVDHAQSAIEGRIDELAKEDRRGSAEWQALQDALFGLSVLRRESDQ
jgi:PAS domain-containing protein